MPSCMAVDCDGATHIDELGKSTRTKQLQLLGHICTRHTLRVGKPTAAAAVQAMMAVDLGP